MDNNHWAVQDVKDIALYMDVPVGWLRRQGWKESYFNDKEGRLALTYNDSAEPAVRIERADFGDDTVWYVSFFIKDIHYKDLMCIGKIAQALSIASELDNC